MRDTAPKSREDKFVAMITVVALVISSVTAVVVVSADVMQWKYVRSNRDFVTIASPSGRLAGYNAQDGTEWSVPDGSDATLVLFMVGAAGSAGDLSYWSDVVASSRAAGASIQFVGFCASAIPCEPPSRSEAALTLLTAMDPSQVHGLAKAARRGQVLVYRGQALQTMLQLRSDKESFAREIVAKFLHEPIKGPT